MTLLQAFDLAVEFPGPGGPVRVVDGVSFTLERGETLALVGESGSGKTLTLLAVLGLVPPPGRVVAGRAFYGERNLLRLSERALRALRGRELAIVFQDPLSALHPLLTVERQLTEVLEAHASLPRRAARARALEALGEVGLSEPERVLASMATLLRPAVLFADEPTTALDATVQRQVLALLAELRERHGTAIVLVSHDLARVLEFADRVQVLYAGRTVESAPASALARAPRHPYTRGLLASAPRLDGPLAFPLPVVPGQPPDPAARPGGCAFHPRCELARARCAAERPALEERAGTRLVACFEAGALP
jgi:oligopeptide transport system ATP-binding protein